MKFSFLLVSLLLLPAFEAPAQGQFQAQSSSPAHLTLLFEWIELEHSDLHELAGVRRLPLEGPEIRKEVRKLIQAGKATVIEAISSHATDRLRGRTESVEELIYPTEFDPPETNSTGEGTTPATPTAFETRNVGFTVEYEPKIWGDRLVDLELAIEKVEHRGYRKMGKAESEIVMPDFYTIRSVQKIFASSGRPRLLAIHRPAEPVDPNRKDPRVMVFVRATVHGADPTAATKEVVEAGKQLSADEMAFLFETIETDQRRLNELLVEENRTTRGPDLREALLEDVAGGKASLAGTSFVAGRSGTEAQLYSILEIIYPTEFDPPGMSANGARVLPTVPAAMQTEHIGQTIQITPTLNKQDIFMLSASPEVVTQIGEIVHGKADAEVRVPHFHTQKVTSVSPLVVGEDSLLGTFRPPDPVDPKRRDVIHVLFVRGELIPIGAK